MLLACVSSCVAVGRIKLVKVQFSRVIFKGTKNQVVHMFEKKNVILYINLVSLSVCPGRYILNPCEQGVVLCLTCLLGCAQEKTVHLSRS
jgi:hypothetical protein